MKLKYILKDKNISIFKDFSLNIIASIIITIATQLIAYPYISRILSSYEYGIILTVMGVVNAVGVSLGNPLNNTRILLQSEYDEENLNGDYNIIFLFAVLVNTIIVGVVTIFVLGRFEYIVIGCIVISILVLFRAYYSASYRIIINYKKNLYSNIFGFIGYLIGIVVSYLTNNWIYIFILGELLSCIYIFFTANIVHDRFGITKLFNKSLRKYGFIMFAAVLSTVLTYVDRFFIYPLLGAEQVSIYTVASYLGKTAGIVMNPISGVLLTYYAKESKMSLGKFYKRVGVFTICSIIVYIGIIILGLPITKILYPTLIDKALPFFWIANLAAIIFILGNTIQPTLLRYCNEKWQPVIQGIYFILYFLLGSFGMKKYGLIGFCYSSLIVNIVKIVIMMLITTITLYNDEGREIND